MHVMQAAIREIRASFSVAHLACAAEIALRCKRLSVVASWPQNGCCARRVAATTSFSRCALSSDLRDAGLYAALKHLCWLVSELLSDSILEHMSTGRPKSNVFNKASVKLHDLSRGALRLRLSSI